MKIRRVALTLIATLSLSLFGGLAAEAATPSAVPVQAISQSIVVTAGDKCLGSSSDIGSNSCLPLNRWGEATSEFHDRLGSKWWNDMSEKGQRQVQSWLASGGTFLWQLAGNLAGEAVNFSVLDKAGVLIDSSFAKIAKALLGDGDGKNGPSLVVFMVIISAVATAFRVAVRKDQSAVRKFITCLVIVGSLAVMITGATNSRMGSTTTNGPSNVFIPGKFSPGWFINTLNKTFGALTDGPTKALAGARYAETATSTYVTCDDYVRALNARALGTSRNSDTSSVSLIISQMWVNSGLQTWAKAQYGSNNSYGQNAYCHQLEWQAGTNAGPHRAIFLEGANVGTAATANTKAFNPSPQGVETDNSLVAWGACQLKRGSDPAMESSWVVDSAWSKTNRGGQPGDKGGSIDSALCARWFTDADFASNKSSFEFVDGEQIAESTKMLSDSDGDVRDYLLTLQGHKVSSGMVASLAYVLSGVAVLIAFGVVSLAIMLGKIAQIVMMLGLAFVMVMSLWVGKADDAKVARYAKSLIGTSIFVAAASILMSMLTLMTDIIVTAGYATFGNSSLIGVIWTGFSPLIAMASITMAFKAMGGPSPFKLSSALAFGAAAGGVGGMVAGKINSVGQRAANSVKNRASGMVGGHSAVGGRGAAGGGRGGRPGNENGRNRSVKDEALRRGTDDNSGTRAIRDIGRGRRRSTEALTDADLLTREDQKIAARKYAGMSASEKMEMASEQRGYAKRLRGEVKTQRRIHNDALAEKSGWKPKGRVDESGARQKPRLMSRDWAARNAALAKGKAGEKIRSTRQEVRQNPAAAAKRALKVTAATAAIAGTGGVLAAPILGVAAVRGVRSGAVGQATRTARERVMSGGSSISRDEYLNAVHADFEKTVAPHSSTLRETDVSETNTSRTKFSDEAKDNAAQSVDDLLLDRYGPLTRDDSAALDELREEARRAVEPRAKAEAERKFKFKSDAEIASEARRQVVADFTTPRSRRTAEADESQRESRDQSFPSRYHSEDDAPPTE